MKSLLVANRGEIAVRVIRTAREMGIRTIAIFSELDRDALHVDLADEAWNVGPAPAAESYLNQEAILRIAHDSGAEAIHPGYGLIL
jgi:3-methylcrotonyl-CoA carboxylase alpha subunit